MKQIPLAIAVEPIPSFDNFVPGPNEAAIEHLRGLRANSPPVYLWGEGSCGKTHLLSAAAHELQAAGGLAAWFGAGERLPWQLEDGWGLVLMDDVHALDAAEQQAAFALMIDAGGQGVPVLAAGRQPPVDLPLREDLRTRLAWGHVFELHGLAEAESRAALRRHADQRGLMLSDEVMGYLLARYSRDMKALVALIAELDTFGLATSRPLTVPLLKMLLAEREPVV